MQKSLHSRQYALLLQELRAARVAAGCTQVEMAKRLGMSQSDVSKCERGIRRLDVIELRLWANALGTTLVAFIGELDRRIAADQVVLGLA